jgi:hypothetical protein
MDVIYFCSSKYIPSLPSLLFHGIARMNNTAAAATTTTTAAAIVVTRLLKFSTI